MGRLVAIISVGAMCGIACTGGDLPADGGPAVRDANVEAGDETSESGVDTAADDGPDRDGFADDGGLDGGDATDPDPPGRPGVYAIWYVPKLPHVLDYEFVVGGQAVVQWKEVEPTKGSYDFAALDGQLALLAASGKQGTVQLNGDKKPDYLFGEVPYHESQWCTEVKDVHTLMYWHPSFRSAHTKLIEAFARHLEASPYRDSIAGIRMNYNPAGTECYNQAADYPYVAPGIGGWTVPLGVDPNTAQSWNLELRDAYLAEVETTHFEQFRDGPFVFLRTQAGKNGRNADVLGSGQYGLFTTNGSIEPHSTQSEKTYNQTFMTYARPGLTRAYLEDHAFPWGCFGGLDCRWASPPQWNWWRVLFELHMGISYIAIRGKTLDVAETGQFYWNNEGTVYDHDDQEAGTDYKGEFKAAFDFANTYAGYHARPDEAPGAWIAFRHNEEVLEQNEYSLHELRIPAFQRDYTFLMHRTGEDAAIPLNRKDDSDLAGLSQHQRFGAWAVRLPAGERIGLTLHEQFAAGLAGNTVGLRVIYLDDGKGEFRVRLFDRSFVLARDGGGDLGSWQESTFTIDGATVVADQTDGSHVIITGGTSDAILHMVEVRRGGF